MKVGLAFVLAIVAAGDMFIGAASAWHFRRYTLPGWRSWRIALAGYGLLSLLFLGLAAWSLFRIPS